ncbi:hypothetical protein ACRALDRAFT_2033060 [Sodiomyces alcalophilus JCM 7366]|uniref:uncharacterized protein n=1 Tax=Sodiomyces alcalophilus JCM 7366 TaxID=591952 RepID=UPI0039B59996
MLLIAESRLPARGRGQVAQQTIWIREDRAAFLGSRLCRDVADGASRKVVTVRIVEGKNAFEGRVRIVFSGVIVGLDGGISALSRKLV